MTPKPEIKDILKEVKQFKINNDTDISSLITDSVSYTHLTLPTILLV